MEKVMYDSLIISVREFMVLAALCGITRIDFPMKRKQGMPDQKEVNLILFRLYQKQILKMKDENTYGLDSEIRKIFTSIKDSEYEIRAYSTDQQNPILFFVGKEVIAAEISENDREALKLHSFSRKRFAEELCNQKLLPLKDSPKEEDTLEKGATVLLEQLQKDRQKFIKDRQTDVQALLKYSEEKGVNSFFIIKDRQADVEKGLLLILDGGIRDYMAYMEKDCLEVRHYAEAEAKEILLAGTI